MIFDHLSEYSFHYLCHLGFLGNHLKSEGNCLSKYITMALLNQLWPWDEITPATFGHTYHLMSFLSQMYIYIYNRYT